MSKLQAVAARLEALGNATTRRKAVVGVALAAIVWVAALVVPDGVKEVVARPLRDGFNVLLQLPMGVGGTLLVVLVAACVLLAFVDTSPTANVLRDWLRRRGSVAPSPEPTLVITAEDRDFIQPIRAFWITVGNRAVEKLDDLIYAITEWRTAELYWVGLLIPKRRALEEARKALTETLSGDRPAAFVTVQQRLDALTTAYFDVAIWLAYIDHRTPLAQVEKYQTPLERWRAANKPFRHALFKDIATRPENQSKVLAVPGFQDQYVHEFLDTNAAMGPAPSA